MYFIDTHSHLFSKDFDDDIHEVITECKNRNVNKIILPNINIESYTRLINTYNLDTKLFYKTIGIHPCDIDNDYQYQLEFVNNVLDNDKDIIAIGEIGIDLYWDKSNIELQKKMFEQQIILAKKYNLPVIIHTRDSFEEVYKLVERHNDENLSGVFHCFVGNCQEAEKIINLGNFYLGIGGVITFKNSTLQNELKKEFINNIILETDSPYLTPTPYRGKRNNSSYIPLIANKLADIFDMSLVQIANNTSMNAEKLFDI